MDILAQNGDTLAIPGKKGCKRAGTGSRKQYRDPKTTSLSYDSACNGSKSDISDLPNHLYVPAELFINGIW